MNEELLWFAVFSNVVLALAVLTAVIAVKRELAETNDHLTALRGMAERDAMRSLENEIESEQ